MDEERLAGGGPGSTTPGSGLSSSPKRQYLESSVYRLAGAEETKASKEYHQHQQQGDRLVGRRDSKASTVAANVGETDTDTATTNVTNNFEYDDNEWDIGIGDLIIDLDADIEKTRDEKLSSGNGMASTPASAAATNNQNQSHQSHQLQSNQHQVNNVVPHQNSLPLSTSSVNAVHINSGNPGKMAVEHSATVDKGLKMKIKRTKTGTKTSETKHEIVKSNEINGTSSNQDGNGNSTSSNSSTSSSGSSTSSSSSTSSQNSDVPTGNSSSSSNKSKPHSPASGPPASSTVGSKRGSSGHRRDKARDKHEKPQSNSHGPQQNSKPEMNGTARPVSQGQNSTGAGAQSQGPTPAATAPQQPQGPPPSSRTGFPGAQGVGPPATSAAAPCPPPSPASATAAGSAAKPEQTKVAAVPGPTLNTSVDEAMDTAACSSPPMKKMKTSNSEPKRIHTHTSTLSQVKLGGEGKGSSRSNSSRNSGAAREVRGSRVEGLKSILCGLRPREYRNEYTSKHEGETTPKSRGWKFPPLPSSFFPSYSRRVGWMLLPFHSYFATCQSFVVVVGSNSPFTFDEGSRADYSN
ncbi:Protein of unknown function [Cotesia congregata]|uniref:Uncharacterized protein n=1 Tax=Cotesia congregata TaxID=51543 RepID=A0A8J2MN49_COTCN|nr:Protein of unknown function [Cotesia congregata]